MVDDVVVNCRWGVECVCWFAVEEEAEDEEEEKRKAAGEACL